MSHQITKHPELVRKENIVKDLQNQLKKKQSTLKSLKTRLKNIQQDIADISRQVQTRVMQKLEQLDQLRQEIAELARQLKKSKNLSKEDKKALGGMAEDFSGEDAFGDGYEQYKEYKEKMESGNFDFDEEQRAKMRDVFEQFKVKPPEEEQRNIRKVFLKLSQKFHPDLAKNKKEEADFHNMMQQINEAYQRNDIQTLLEWEQLYLTEELDFTSSAITMDVLDAAIEKLEKEIQFIENQINRTSKEIKSIRKSDMGNMLTAVNKAEREGEGFEAMEEQHNQAIEIFTKMRDGLRDSVKIDGISPILMEMMMGDTMGNFMDEEDLDMEDFMEMMGMMKNAHGHDDGFFDDDEEEEEREQVKNPTFPIDSSVRVKKKTLNDFHKKTDMKDWEGRVMEVYYDKKGKQVYIIEFDSITMEQMSVKLINEAIEEEEEFNEHEFSESQLEASQARDTEMQTFQTYRTIFHQNRWSYLGKNQAKRIENILLQDPTAIDSENWTIYLKEHLVFPFKARARGLYNDRGVTGNLRCEVLSLDFFDENAGHILMVKPQGSRKNVQHPLADIIPIKVSSKMKEVIEDYQEWTDEMLMDMDDY